jgi:copper chaperone
MEKVILNVEGMSCNHCVNAVNKAVSALAGVTAVDVNLEAKKVTVEYAADKVTVADIKAAIEDQGYDVV